MSVAARVVGCVALLVCGDFADAQVPTVNLAAEAPSRAYPDAVAPPSERYEDEDGVFVSHMALGEDATTRIEQGDSAAGATPNARVALPEVVASRGEALRAVVRLRDVRRLVCTATVVRHGRAVGLITAAHCLFAPTSDGAVGALRTTLEAENLGAVDPATAWIDPRFRACAQQGRPWQQCVEGRAEDLAWIPLGSVPAGVRPWSLCGVGGTTSRDVTAFGYGLNGRALPRALLQGAFRVVAAGRTGGVRRAYGVSSVRVDAGDSGGPVIPSRDDLRMSGRLPCVAYVVVAVQVGAVDEGYGTSAAWMQPLDGAVVFRARQTRDP